MNLLINGLKKSYDLPEGGRRTVLKLDELSIDSGEKVAIYGPSGSGKSTFLNVISGMVPVSAGQIFFADVALHTLSEAQRDQFRARHLGYVFQNFHLFNGYSALENVLMGMLFSGRKTNRTKALELLDRVGLKDRANEVPGRLSTGQRQRVAIARALAHDPEIILADEPTGNLDPANTSAILDLLFDVSAGKTLLLVTHEKDVLARFSRTIELKPAGADA